jgi:hypothetical protein
MAAGESLPGRFDGRVGHDVIVRAVATPFYSAAHALLEQGLAQPNDTLVMRHGRTSGDRRQGGQIGANVNTMRSVLRVHACLWRCGRAP